MHSLYARAAPLTFGARLAGSRLTREEIAWFFNCPQQLLDVECGAPAHIPGDTTSPPVPGAIQIGPLDV